MVTALRLDIILRDLIIVIKAIYFAIYDRVFGTGWWTESDVEFSIRQLRVMQNAFLFLQICLGYDLKLFGSLADCKTPVTAKQLAEKCNYRERYILEWLKCMVAGNIVETNDENTHYWLPVHRQKTLVEDNGQDSDLLKLWNLKITNGHPVAALSKLLPCLAHEYNEIKDRFTPTAPPGMGYESYLGFHKWMGDMTRRHWESVMIPYFLPDLPIALQKKLALGAEVIEIGAGRATPSLALASHFQNSQFTAVDLCDEPCEKGNKLALSSGILNINYVQGDSANLPKEWNDKFDYAMIINSLHDMGRPVECLQEVHRILKPGGYLSVVELAGLANAKKNAYDNPLAPILYTVSLFHCMPISLHEPGGVGLGTMAGTDTFEKLVASVGFREMNFNLMNHYSWYGHISGRK